MRAPFFHFVCGPSFSDIMIRRQKRSPKEAVCQRGSSPGLKHVQLRGGKKLCSHLQ